MKKEYNSNQHHMVDEVTEKICTIAKDVTLTSEEKEAGALHLTDFIKSQSTLSQPSPLPSPFFTHALTPISVLSLFLLLASTCYAASDALPGDILYPVKIAVNEEVQSMVAVTDSAKAIVKTRHAVNRLKEAEVLEAKGKLDDKKSEEIITRFAVESKNVERQAEKVAVEGDVQVANAIKTEFKKSISTHNEILDRLSKKSKKEVMKGVEDEKDSLHILIQDESSTSTIRQSDDAPLRRLKNKER